ncbi:lipopolysaccharide biosynthesis protein [Vibrio splendidus]
MVNDYKSIKFQIINSVFFKVGTIVLNYALTSLLFRYLGQEKFGIYVAFISFFSWMFLFDLGVAKGMRNYLTKSYSDGDHFTSRQYISTNYITIFFICVFSFVAIFFISISFDIGNSFKLASHVDDIKYFLIVLLIGFFVKFYLSSVDQMNFALHRSHIVSLNVFLTALFNVVGVFLVGIFSQNGNLNLIILVFSISIVLPYFFSTLEFFIKYKYLRPSFSFINKDVLKKITSSGGGILLVQIVFLLMIGLDKMLILKYSDPIEVADYEIMYKVMSLILLPMTIIISPLWSSFSNAYHNNDRLWIKGLFVKFYKLFSLLILLALVLTLLFDNIVWFWLGHVPRIDLFSPMLMSVMILQVVWCTFHSDFLLGINKLRVTICSGLIGLILKFVIIAFVIHGQVGLSKESIIISTIVAYACFNIYSPLYIKRLLERDKHAN